MPVNQKPKNNLRTFIETIQTLSDEKYNSLTRSNLKSSKTTPREKTGKYLQKALRDILFDMSQIKITKLSHEIVENVFDSQKNFDHLVREECSHLSRIMPFLQSDQIKGHALENAGFKTICGELDKRSLIERYTLNKIVIPDQVQKEARNQKVGWNERVTVFEVDEDEIPTQEFEGFKGFEESEISKSSRENNVVASLQAESNDSLTENLALKGKIDDDDTNNLNEAESSASFINNYSDESENSLGKENSNPQSSEENDSDAEFNGFDPEDIAKNTQKNSNLSFLGFDSEDSQGKNSPPKEPPPQQSSDDEESSSLEIRRQMYSKASEENFLFGQRHSDDEEILQSSLTVLDDNQNIETENREESSLNPKKRKCSISSPQWIHRERHPPFDQGEKKFKGQEYEFESSESSQNS